MQLGIGLNLSGAPQYGGTTGAGTGVEATYLLDESNAPILMETGAELLLEA